MAFLWVTKSPVLRIDCLVYIAIQFPDFQWLSDIQLQQETNASDHKAQQTYNDSLLSPELGMKWNQVTVRPVEVILHESSIVTYVAASGLDQILVVHRSTTWRVSWVTTVTTAYLWSVQECHIQNVKTIWAQSKYSYSQQENMSGPRQITTASIPIVSSKLKRVIIWDSGVSKTILS